ncbi:hypothetical protein BDFB_011902, partial [Asbolus verrucosus]
GEPRALYFEYGLHGRTKVENIAEVVADVPVSSVNVKRQISTYNSYHQEIGRPGSLSTVYRRIEAFGLNSYRPTRRDVFLLLLPRRQPDFNGVELGETGPTNGIG